MNIRKIISLIVSLSVVFTYMTLPASASTGEIVKTVTYINEDFEDGDISDWDFRTNTAGGSSGTKSATVVEENSNKFLRVSYTGTHVSGDGKVVMFSKKFSDGLFDIPDDGVTVVELKFRTNQMNLRKMLKFNYPTSNEFPGNYYNESEKNTRSFMLMHTDGKVYYASGNASNHPDQGNNVAFYTGYSANKWYRLKMVMDYSSQKVYFSIYDNDTAELLVSTGAKDMSAWWFNYHDANKSYEITDQLLKDFSLIFRNAATVNDERVDIDDFKVYVQKSIVETEVIPNTDIGIIHLPTEVSLKFDAPLVLSDSAVSVVDSEGNTVTHTGSFDAKILVYTADFGTQLAGGDYKFVIDPEYVVPVNESEGIFANIGIVAEVPFKVYNALPPVASDAEIEGRVILGQIINADYTYTSDVREGSSEYEWYSANLANAPENEWEVLNGQNFKELEVTDAVLGKYVKFAVTPINEEGLSGTKVFSNVIAPERAPVANNVAASSSSIFTKSYISADYDYFDENDDKETDTEIIWYVSENGTDGWQQFDIGKNTYISENQKSKYIKLSVVPVNDSDVYPRGSVYESAVYGPVTDILVATNKFSNAGLESGDLTSWEMTGTEDYKGIEVTDNNPYSGSYALRVHPRIVNANDKWWQKVSLQAGKRYILSAMARKNIESSPNTSEFEGYLWSGTADRPYRSSEYTRINSSEVWERVTLTFDTQVTGDYDLSFISFNPINVDMVLDDFYIGELIITDIDTPIIEPVTIPKNGTVEIPFAVGSALNQFGDTKGLTTQVVNINLNNYPGVVYKDNKIIVESTAVSGTLSIEVSCEPDYRGASQSVFTKQIDIELIAHNDTTPKALNVNATGSVSAGNTLEGSYDFYQVNGEEDASDVRWMYSESENGVYYDIPGATSDTYVVEPEYADKYIKFAVTPKTLNGLVGPTAVSDYLAVPTAPTAKKLSVSGDFNVGGTVKGYYEFNDINKDDEGTTKFKWYYSDTENGSYDEITGAYTDELVLTNDLINKYIKFAVTPISETYPENGEEVLSKAYAGPATPVVSNVVIENKNNILVATYDFYHPHNAKEQNSIYEWKVGGNVVSTQRNYVVNFSGTQTVTFSVTPVAVSNPSTGKTVSVSMSVTGNSSSAVGGGTPVTGGFAGGGSSGGGGASVGGSGIASGITSINDMELPVEKIEDKTAEITKSDIDGHWGEEYIRNMEARGIMTADTDGRYNPDELVNRQDMLTYLFKTIDLEKSEYSGMFNDVADPEFGGILQTMVDNGTISVDTSFRPDDSISREEMCKILYISLENAGKLETIEDGLINGLSDFTDISDWAVKYVNAMYGIKMMIGVSEDRFAPGENVTKAQAATMLTRIISLMEEE